MSIIFAWFFLSVTYIVYNYAQTYPSGVKILPTFVHPEDKVARMKMRLSQQDLLRPRNRKLKKESMVTPNSSAYDSNRAVEMELNETEYEDMLRGRDIAIRIFDLPVHTSKPSDKKIASRFLGLTPECSRKTMEADDGEKRERFPDLLEYLAASNPLDVSLKKTRITLQEIHGIENTQNYSHLDMFHISISDLDLYAEDDPNINTLLNSIATQPIVHVEEKQGGTQLKLIITFQDGSQALFKPMS